MQNFLDPSAHSEEAGHGVADEILPRARGLGRI